MLRKLAATALLFATLACGANLEHKRRSKKYWFASLAALGAASFLDVHSSWGKPEANALLRSPGGGFGARGVQVKLGIVGGSAAIQWLVLRRRPDMDQTFAGVNAGMAAWTTGVAVRNYR